MLDSCTRMNASGPTKQGLEAPLYSPLSGVGGRRIRRPMSHPHPSSCEPVACLAPSREVPEAVAPRVRCVISTERGGRVGRSSAVGAIAVALLAVAGCNSNGGDSTKASRTNPPPAPSGQVPTTPDAEGSARAAALEVYGRFTQFQDGVEAGGSLDGMGAVANGRAAELVTQVRDQSARTGLVVEGPPGTPSPQVETVSLTTNPPQVVLTDCVDLSHQRVVYRDTRAPFTVPSQSPRYVKRFVITRSSTGSWLVTDMISERDRPC